MQNNIDSMKHVELYESFIKGYGEKITPEQFKKIKRKSTVLYLGTPYTVVKNDEFVLHLKSESGQEKTVNLGMFNRAGAIVE